METTIGGQRQEASPQETQAIDPRRYFEKVERKRAQEQKLPVCLYLETTNR